MNDDSSTTRFLIGNMTCGGCEKAVAKAIGNVPGVGEVHVDRTRGEARVQWTADTDAGHRARASQDICSAVEAAGFDCLREA